ncbi:tetratricopeptide repeat protein [Methylovirgula sp. 4M-Z18]|uniref:tetratricopeptide repeat protein n=1 Tax=Methylovirgula sp. 4M-Z18 TaxID=2293567 RepID=UPI000E2F3A49|nr:tetratricopeptide repeat protein [Methylovirgula sp. 4M-Z18]RFB81417.1 sel1 repeat family protein [Methylovirgula sp. 4M-Z18]
MSKALILAHRILWYDDKWYRLCGYVAPALLATLGATCVLSWSNNWDVPGQSQADWIKPQTPAQVLEEAHALRDRAAFDPVALNTLRGRADVGDPVAQFDLASLYDTGLNLSKNFGGDMPTAMHYYYALAQRGDMTSEYRYGFNLVYGKGVPADPGQGIPWIVKSANGNYIPAMRTLATIYRSGTGVAANPQISLEWTQKAADAGDHLAQAEIGDAFWFGAPPYPKDPAKAVEWFLKAAADPKQVEARWWLGVAYHDGTGVQIDQTQAMNWFRQAAELGDVRAAAQLGIGYFEGKPPYTADNAQAFKWLKFAANSPKESVAQRDLGLMYFAGRGTPADLNQAKSWLQQASTNGDPVARDLLARMSTLK